MAVRQNKKSKSWYVDFRFNYQRYQKKSPDNSRAGAQAYEAMLRSKLARGEELFEKPRARGQTLGQFAPKWFEEYVTTNNKPAEQKAKQHILSASLVPFFGNMPLEKVGAHEIERYKAHELRRGVSNKTVNNKLAVLRKCLITAHDWGFLETAPLRIRMLKCTPAKTDHLTQEECDRLLSHTGGTLREMVLLALRTGMRQSEIRGLQWESIDWENRMLVVRHSLCDYANELQSTKTNRERVVPLHDDVFGTLFLRRQASGYVFTNERGRPFKGEAVRRHLQKARVSAELRNIGWHTLRHTVASRMAMGGVSLRTVQDVLGHSTITMTMRYAHVAPEQLRAAINMLH